MTDQNRSNTGAGASGTGTIGGTDSIGLGGGSAGTSGLSDAGVGAAGGTTAVKSAPAKRAATKASGARSTTTSAGDTSGASGGGAKAQLRDGAAKVKQQAGGKAREYAAKGKDQAMGKLDDAVRMINDAADQVEERLGPQYAGYARSAADAVAGFSSTLRQKDVDELLEDTRNFVRKSPAIAIGAAAAIGFVLARVVRSGLEPTGPNVDADQGPGSAPSPRSTPTL